ncbi:hypothetical protein ACFXHA_33965 [Nocardia sp. NPDC059240]|uniref:hypothetical protein n=1 Tax=Nocardia sp. NPDC059240 TaxID=3346786 RepID=UPI003699818D
MKSLHTVVVAASLTVGITGGTASADAPAVPDRPGTTLSTDVLPGLHYTASVVDHSVVLRTDAGRITVRGSEFEILDAGNNLAFGMPLTYRLNEQDWPIAARIDADGRTITLTPGTDPVQAVPAASPNVEAVFSQDELNNAIAMASSQIGLATAIGGMVGAAIGLVGGCVAGMAVGTALMPPAFLVGAPGGCIAGAAVGGGLGGAIGTLALGVPVTLITAIEAYNILTSG